MYPPNPVTGYTSLEWCTRALTDEAFAVESPKPFGRLAIIIKDVVDLDAFMAERSCRDFADEGVEGGC